MYCGHTTFNTKITLFLWGGGGKKRYHSGKCFSLNLYFPCPNGQVVIKTYVAPLSPRTIAFDAMDFSECHSKEVIKFLLTLSVVLNTEQSIDIEDLI